jgi:hypothetical protein
MTTYHLIIALILGVGLGAACGFRVFVPMLMTSLALKAGLLTVSPSFDWLGSDVALAVFAAATVIEIFGYLVPWVDHTLDLLASPCAVVAGTVLSASFITGMDPMLKWSLAVVAGGGAAGLVQAGSVTVRAASSVLTAGVANPFISALESIAAFLLATLIILAPLLALLTCILIGLLAVKWHKKRKAQGLHFVPGFTLKPASPVGAQAAGPLAPQT